MDEGGSCKRFTDLPWIRYGSPTEHYGDPRTGLQISFGLFFFYLQTLFMSLRLDPAMFCVLFVGTEASWMKGMSHGHPGWVYRQ